MPFTEGLHPDGTPGATFYISRSLLEVLETDGPEWKLEDARFILECVRDPDVIFQGLLRPRHEESLCFSVRPSHDPDEEGEFPSSLPRYGFVFVAFARLAVGGYLVFDWEWREEDGEHPGHPSGWQTDFERPTWRKT